MPPTVFGSDATNLVPNDTNNVTVSFVCDLTMRRITRVSVNSQGIEGNSWSHEPWVSVGGRFAVFGSSAFNLAPNASGGVFVRDTFRGTTILASTSAAGVPAGGVNPRISSDG